MRRIFSVACMLAALATVGCRPALTPTIPAPASPLPVLPTPVAPRIAVTVTLGVPSRSASTPPVADSGVYLAATIGPTCPGPERSGQVCTQPYAGPFVVTDHLGAKVARAATDENGQATIDLPPGDYVITAQVEGRWPSGAPVAVTVSAGQYVEVNIELDSGMR